MEMSNSSSQSSSSSGGNSPPHESTPPSSNKDDTPPSPSSDTTPPSSSSKSPPSPSSSTTPPSPSSNSPPSPSSTKSPPSPSSEDSAPPLPSSNPPPPLPSSKPPPPLPSANPSPPPPPSSSSSKSTPPPPSSSSTSPSPPPPSPSANITPSPSSEDSTPPLPSSNPPPPLPSSKPPPPLPSANTSPPPPPPSSSLKSTPPPPSSNSMSPSPPPPSPSSNSPPPPSPSSNTPPPLPSSKSPPPPSSSSNSTLPAQGSKSLPPPASSNSPPPGPPPPSSNGSPPPNSQGNNFPPPPLSPPSSATPHPSEKQPPGPPQNSVPPPSTPPGNGTSPISMPSPNKNGSPTTPSNPSTAPTGDLLSNRTAVIVTISALVVIILVIAFVLIRRTRRNGLKHQSPGRISIKTDGYKQPTPIGVSGRSNPYYSSGLLSGPLGVADGSARYGYNSGSQLCFTYEEMMNVTNGFSEENIIGEGGFGCVYKGCLQDGKKVAVKQLRAGSGQGEREFRAEVEIISRVHHRYLVSLVGYCIAESHRLLVYEFLPNNTLEHHLHGLPVMEWSKRVKIAIGSAKGLAYLHEDCHPRIIHRDIKSANILLEDSFEPQVADFGLAKLSNDTTSHVSTRVMGTFGYMAPEYASSGKLTDRSDVFSFGVVLLELITGRKPVDTTQPLGDESLVEWARPLLVHALETGECEKLVDPRLENNYDRTQMLRMIEAAAACVRHSAPKRPRMSQVVRALDIEDDMQDLTNGIKIGQSQAFNSGQASSSDLQKFRQMAFSSSGTDSFEYDSGEYDRRSSAHSGDRRRDQRPPGPGGWIPGTQSSNSSANHISDARSMFQNENSTGGGNSRGMKYY